mmetsp:Transcript_53332/g.104338  ORF Transcript_53332/g.104338 Transcript_53332/m.104338 type:complete len:171 (-) Transcript_53332:223-735(-)
MGQRKGENSKTLAKAQRKRKIPKPPFTPTRLSLFHCTRISLSQSHLFEEKEQERDKKSDSQQVNEEKKELGGETRLGSLPREKMHCRFSRGKERNQLSFLTTHPFIQSSSSFSILHSLSVIFQFSPLSTIRNSAPLRAGASLSRALAWTLQSLSFLNSPLSPQRVNRSVG